MRKSQDIADVIVPIPLIKKDGTQAIALALTTLSTKVIGPDGLAVTGYTEATFTEPNGDGVYVCKFPSTAAIKAFTLADQANPYQLTLDSSAIDVEPTTVPVWTVSKYPWELASQSTADSILTESQSHPTLTEIEASTVLAKEATLTTIMTLLNSIQADLGDPSADVTTIYAQVLAIKGYVDELESLLKGGGEYQATLQFYLTGTTTPIPGVSAQIFNSDQTVLITRGVSDELGRLTRGLANGAKKVRPYKVGYSFITPQSFTVSGDGVCNIYGSVIEIGVPASINTCRVYEWCFKADDSAPVASVMAKAYIVNTPYDYNGKLHAGDVINGVYDPLSGKVCWDIVYGATVEFRIAEMGLDVKKTIPSVTSKRLSEI